MALDPDDLPADALAFLTERHLGTLTTLRPDGSPHVVPVGFTYDVDARLVRVIASRGSRKVANARATGRAAVCSVDGGRWLTFEGPVTVHDDPVPVAEGVARYAARYRPPRVNPDRVVLHLAPARVLGRA